MARGKPVRSELKKIFADPRNWFTSVAWFLSIALSLFLNHQQNQKWNALNHPQIQLTNIFLIPFETLSQDTPLNRHWGYHPLVFSILENGIERIQAFTELAFIDRTTKDRVFGSRRMMKLEDAGDEQKRLNLANVELVKHFQMKVSFRNAGQLSATNVAVRIEYLLSTDSGQNPSFQGTPAIAEVSNAQEFHVTQDGYLPLNVDLPPELKLRISINYEFAGKSETKVLVVKYDSRKNQWNWD